MKLAIQLAESAMLDVAGIASAGTSSLTSKNGIGPSPVAKEEPKVRRVMAERIWWWAFKA